jgi:hypothetical protein
MSLTPIPVDPAPSAPPTSFSVSACVELAKGILSRGFVGLLLCGLVLLAVQVPPGLLGMAQSMSQELDRSEQAAQVAAGARTPIIDEADEDMEDYDIADEDPPFITAFREAFESRTVDPSPRTLALGVISNCFSLVWFFLVQLPVMMGAFLMAIRTGRGESPAFRDILHGYRRLPAQWGAAILQYLAALPLYVVGIGSMLLSVVAFLYPASMQGVSPGLAAVSGALGILLAIVMVPALIVGTWISIRVLFSVMAVIDPAMSGVGPIAAVGVSWRVTRGHALGLLGLMIIVGVIAIVTALCCLVPLFVFGIPATFALLAAAWLLLMRRECPGAPPTIVRGADGQWSAPSQMAPAFDPNVRVPPDFRA